MASFITYFLVLLALTEFHIGVHMVSAADHKNCSDSVPCEFCHCNPDNLATKVDCKSWGACSCELDDKAAANNLLPPNTAGNICYKVTSGDCYTSCGETLQGYLCQQPGYNLCYCGRKNPVSDYYGCKEPTAAYKDQACPLCNCKKGAKRAGCYDSVCRCDKSTTTYDYLATNTATCKKAKAGGFCAQKCTKDYTGWICPGNRLPMKLCYCVKN